MTCTMVSYSNFGLKCEKRVTYGVLGGEFGVWVEGGGSLATRQSLPTPKKDLILN